MSKKKINYRQCKVTRKHDGSETSTVSWIPEKFAILNKVLKLKDKDEKWTDGWIVESVGSSILEESQLPDAHKSVKAHRKATGDALPKRKGK